MLFNSVIFIFVFLPLVLIIYYILPQKMKNIFLLLSSLFFYSWGSIKYLLLLIVSIVINYIIGILISFVNDNKFLKKMFFIMGIFLNLGLLFYYKYFDFTILTINKVFNLDIPLANIVLPIGISFFTFQGMSYIIDVYLGEVSVNKNFIHIALYISMFPQLVAGPIVKYSDINDQINERSVTLESFAYGIKRFVFGLSKKVMIADVLGQVSDKIFDAINIGIDVPTAWLGIICYTLQIYFDFSAYSDMAIGLGHFFGFSFLENFNYPYISKSITEFWRRWHISLSSWFRDYLYIPLGGNRKGNVYVNLFIVFLVTGLWHGAEWTFILWGIWYGIFIIIEKKINTKSWYQSIPIHIKWLSTIFIVMMGWVLFRANNFKQAIVYYKHLFGIKSFDFVEFSFPFYINNRIIVTLIIAFILSTPLVSNIFKHYESNIVVSIIKVVIIIILFILSIIFIVNSTYSPFIYFQF